MKKTLKMKMIFWIWGVSFLLFSVVLYQHFLYSRGEMEKELEQNTRVLAQYYAEKFEKTFSTASAAAKMTAVFLATSDFLETSDPEDEPTIINYLKKAVEDNPSIYGMAVAFDPSFFPEKKDGFAPYFFRQKDKLNFVQLAKPSYAYQKKDWYRLPKEKKQPIWSEPYFDEGAGETLMVTYSIPFYYKGEFKGIATADISLLELTDEVNKIKVLKTGYGFIISKNGTFLAYPDKTKILKESIFSFNKALGEKMTSRMSGFMKINDPLRNEKAWIVFYPVNSADFSIGIVYPEKEILLDIYGLHRATITIGVVGLAVLLLTVILLADSIARPVALLAKDAAKIAKGNLNYKIQPDDTIYEVRVLGLSLNKMVEELKEHIERVKQVTIEQERTNSELEIAAKIQKSVLPCKFPAFPDRKDIDVFAVSIPSRIVGGDFYDYFLIDDKRLCFVIGDAAGKGFSAALYMAVSRAFLIATAVKGYPPGECLKYVNSLLCNEDYQDMFITMFYGILDTKTGKLSYCNAGHCLPFIISDKNEVTPLSGTEGMALGISSDAEYKTVSADIGKGILLYTDGVTDAENNEGQYFSEARIYKAIDPANAFFPQDIINKMLEEVKQFAQGQAYADDLTLMYISYNKLQAELIRR